ncbi:MAG: hypothetical protein JSS65_03985 [Armatimonadetes bacterium]|nr:hypothetical protein [Armatimonadota bacterium]
MRAILNFLATALATLASHMGGGTLEPATQVSPAKPTVAVVAPARLDLAASAKGATSAALCSYLVQDKEPATLIKYVRSPKRDVLTRPELPMDKVFAKIPHKVELRSLSKVKEELAAAVRDLPHDGFVSIDVE